MRGALLLAAAVALSGQDTGEVRGTVRDSRGGEPLGRVQVQLVSTSYATLTDQQGRFAFSGVPSGAYRLHVSTVGYRLLRQSFTLSADEVQEFEVILNQDTLRQTDSIEVTAGPFEPARRESPSEITLAGFEAKNLASVLADDPLRAVQALPGVVSNDDFDSRFSLRGAGYSRVGLYFDDILLHSPFHMVAGEEATGSITAVNGDVVESLSLYSGAYPARYADRTAGILAAETREGTRLGPSLRVTASASNAGAVVEGPLRRRRGSWLVAARKSYLQYIIRRTTSDSDPSFAFGILDGQSKIAFDLTSKHHVSLSLVDGFSDLDRTRDAASIGANSIMTGGNHLSLANLTWRYAPGERLMVTSRMAYMRERFTNRNRETLELESGHYGEWAWQSHITSIRGPGFNFDAGWSARRIRGSGFENRYQFNPAAVQRLEDYHGHLWRTGGYIEPAWSGAGGRLRLSAGIRWDYQDAGSRRTTSQHAALVFSPTGKTEFRFGWGMYAQYPEIQWLYSAIGRKNLLPQRANQLVAAIEQRLGSRTRLRAEFYQREDRDLLFRPFYEPRLIGGKIFNPSVSPPVMNSVRGYARGLEVFLQRRSVNRLSGWVSYAYGRTRMRDGAAGISFPADEDQRHTVNVFGSYRIRSSVNLSVKSLYGSGFPLPGFYRTQGSQYFLAESRNHLRVDNFLRIDARINKAYALRRWKLTLHGEVVNVLNRSNHRFSSFDGYNSRTGRVSMSVTKMFPVIPSVGIVVEFAGGSR